MSLVVLSFGTTKNQWQEIFFIKALDLPFSSQEWFHLFLQCFI